MKNNYHSFILLTVVLLASILSFGVYYYVLDAIHKNTAQGSALTDAIASSLTKKASLVSLQNIVSDTESDRDTISNYFIPKEGVADFIGNIENLALEHSLTFNVDSIGTEDIAIAHASSTQTYLKLTLATTGTWENNMNFYSLLENMPYKIKFGSAQFSKDVTSDQQTKIKNTLWKGEVAVSIIMNK